MRGRIRLLGYVRDEIWRRAACPEDVMMSLLADVQGRWHRVYADNLFINLRVLRDARDISVYLCGTARAQILGFHGPFLKMLSRTSQRVSTRTAHVR